MPYYLVNDWRAGIDQRRHPAATETGAVMDLRNAHVTPGGDIEKRFSFVDYGTDIAGTFGVAGLEDSIFIFGRNMSAPPGTNLYIPGTLNPVLVPAAVYFMPLDTLVGPNDPIERIVDVETYDGYLYVVVLTTTGLYQHFYNGEEVDTAVGQHCRTYKSKMYSVGGKDFNFSAIDDPTNWDPGAPGSETGAGSINLSTQDADGNRLTGIEIYYDQMALFSEFAIQFWSLDADPRQNQLIQILRSTGTVAPRSPRQFADGDVLYLATSGVRSLRARNSSNAASVSDIGSPIDKLIQERYRTLGKDEFSKGFCLAHALTGRFWVVFGDRIYILSYFPVTDVTAWSRYDPGFTITAGANVGQRIVLRDATKLYLYGGLSGEEYDSSKVTILTPFYHADNPATFKNFQAIDMVSSGDWDMKVLLDPDDPPHAPQEVAGTFSDVTYNRPRMAITGHSTHIQFEMTHEAAGAASMSQLAVHYELAETM